MCTCTWCQIIGIFQKLTLIIQSHVWTFNKIHILYNLTWSAIKMTKSFLCALYKLVPLHRTDKRTAGEPASMFWPGVIPRLPVPKTPVTVETLYIVTKTWLKYSTEWKYFTFSPKPGKNTAENGNTSHYYQNVNKIYTENLWSNILYRNWWIT